MIEFSKYLGLMQKKDSCLCVHSQMGKNLIAYKHSKNTICLFKNILPLITQAYTLLQIKQIKPPNFSGIWLFRALIALRITLFNQIGVL